MLRFIIACALAVVLASAMLVGTLRWVDPPTSAFMMRERIGAGADAGRIQYEWVPAAAVSAHLKLAVIAAEDQKFPEHSGFDMDSINDALAERERGGRVRGASTLSQQVAKNLFLWPGQSWVRKGLEAWFTVLIETLWPKRRILEVYVNIAEFGPDVFGAGAAARVYFDKPASELTPAEAALMAAVLPNPKRLRVAEPSAYVRSRQEWILGQMRQLGGVAVVDQLER